MPMTDILPNINSHQMDKETVKFNNDGVTTQSEEKQTFIWPLNDAENPYYMSIISSKEKLLFIPWCTVKRCYRILLFVT